MSRRKLIFIGSFDSELSADLNPALLYNPLSRNMVTINIKKQRSSSDFQLDIDDARRFAEEILRQCDILDQIIKEEA